MRRAIIVRSSRAALIMRITTPKAIILAHAANNCCELTPYSTQHYNNHGKGNNTHACDAQSSSAYDMHHSQWRVAWRPRFVFFVSFAVVCFVSFRFLCLVRSFLLCHALSFFLSPLFFCRVLFFCRYVVTGGPKLFSDKTFFLGFLSAALSAARLI